MARAGGLLVYLRTMAVFALAWYGLSLLVGSRLLLPSPMMVAEALWQSALDGELQRNAGVSLLRLLIAMGAAVVTAIPLGIAMGLSRAWREALDLLVEMLRPIAGIAWIPLALFILGIGNRLPIFIMFYSAFFPLVIGTAAGVRNVDQRLLAASATMGVTGQTRIRHVVLPAALPAIMVSLRLAVAASWTAVVAAELVGAPSGLGYAIEYYRSMLATPTVMAFIAVIGVLGFATDAGLRALERRLMPWAKDRRP
jgi:NitT/TauT family transport system permease protein/taurine transport system permease protein